MFGYLAYPKGGWVLHMLRCQLGEDLYRRCIKTYLERHAYGIVVTEDLRAVIEELSGRSFDQFFDQWVYHAHHPELEVSYSWDEKTRLAKVSIRQTQTLNDERLALQFPAHAPVQVQGRHRGPSPVQVNEKEEDFYFAAGAAPEIVRLDPDYTLLAKINFTLPAAMLYAQLGDASDMIGRLLAADQLADKSDASHHREAQGGAQPRRFLRRAHASLRKPAQDSQRRRARRADRLGEAIRRAVRNAVVGDIGGFFHPRAGGVAPLPRRRAQSRRARYGH